MIRTTYGIVTLSLLALLPASAGAQSGTEPMVEVDDGAVGTTLSLFTGSLDGAPTLPAETELTSGTAYGAAVTRWLTPSFGLRARAIYADQRIRDTNHPRLREQVGDGGDVIVAGGDVLLGKDVRAGDLRLRPYVDLGAGFKRYMTEKPWTDLAFNAGVGLETRFGPAGVFGEVNRLVSEFDGASRTQHAGEWLFTGGVTVRMPRL